MPRLNKEQQAVVGEAEGATGYQVLPEGRYAVQLLQVTDEGEGPSGFDYWIWTFHNIHSEDGKAHGGRLWRNLSLSPKAASFLKAAYDAFGFTVDSDTDEMVDEWVGVYLVQETVEQGKNAGKLRNQIDSFFEFDAEDFAFDPIAEGKKAEDVLARSGRREAAF